MIAATRKLLVMDGLTRTGEYNARNAGGLTELWGKTALIVGFGRIGRQVARRCAAFDMTIVIADPYVAREAVEAAGYRYVADFRDALRGVHSADDRGQRAEHSRRDRRPARRRVRRQ